VSRSLEMNVVAFALVIGLVSSVGLRSLQRSGEEAAAADSRWLLERVNSALGSQ
jgi:hypothetical protein